MPIWIFLSFELNFELKNIHIVHITYEVSNSHTYFTFGSNSRKLPILPHSLCHLRVKEEVHFLLYHGI